MPGKKRRYADGYEVSPYQSQRYGLIYALTVVDTGFTLGFLNKDADGWSWSRDGDELEWDRGWTAVGAVRMILIATGPHPPSREPGPKTAETLAPMLIELEKENSHAD
jgi:hypothetical protein